MSAYRAAIRFLGLDAQPDRPEPDVLGTWLDFVLLLVAFGVIVGLLAVRG